MCPIYLICGGQRRIRWAAFSHSLLHYLTHSLAIVGIWNKMAKRGRKPGFVMSDEHRAKISKSNILSRLIRCAEGIEDMSSVQAQVALGLMKKVMPDLQSTDLTAEISHKEVEVPWTVKSLNSTSQDASSSDSTNGTTDGQSSSPTDEQGKPSRALLN